MDNIYEKLTWLLPPPEDFSSRLVACSSINELRKLAQFSLDANQLNRLSNKIHFLQKDNIDFNSLTNMNIGVVSNTTTKIFVPALVGTALRFGISLRVIEAEFNQIAQEAFSANSTFTNHKLNAILVAIDYRGLPLRSSPGNENLAKKNIKDCLAYLRSIIESLKTTTGAQIIIQNIALPVEAISGSYEAQLPGSLHWLISRLNLDLHTLISSNTLILDVAGLAANIGLAKWHDPKLWNVAKLAFSERYIPIYTEYICRILSSKLGKSRRCLILDLDNTLWGGVIGDDGMEGILIGHGDPTAEAHLHLQNVILNIRERGVVLAISSKNEDAIARQPFKEHPDMLLRENHIAVFQANWSDKASNIKAIAETLSLGLESIVFLDDNPAERMQVRLELPEVAVPELPEDPALYATTLVAAGYFEAITFSNEDRKRATFYQDNAKRASILKQSSDINSYLISLNMEISITKFDVTGRARIAQLISKSNQFNLTTKRYSESDIKEIEDNNNFYSRQIRLKDNFGDNGMISVVICKKNTMFWEIDSWLMSCRVLGRQVEIAVLQDIIKNAEASGATKLIGTYIPTSRNLIVKDHYKKLGFTKTLTTNNSETWELVLKDYKMISLPFSYRLH